MPEPPVVRVARPSEWEAVGALTARVFADDGWAQGDYLAVLRDVAGRAAQADVLVADLGGHLVGAVAVATRGGAFAEQAAPGEAVVRMLVVDAAGRGRGVGAQLMAACLQAARDAGCRVVRLSTQPGMAAAHRLYERLGFVRTPGDDWRPEPDLLLWTYALALVPWCDGCGEAVLARDHTGCVVAREHEPPRWCALCRRRLVVQVLPDGWSARCVEHGTRTDAAPGS